MIALLLALSDPLQAATPRVTMRCSPARDAAGTYRAEITALYAIDTQRRRLLQAPRAAFDRRIELRVLPQRLVLDFFYGKYAPDPQVRGQIYEKLVVHRRSGFFESHDYVVRAGVFPGKQVGDLSGESRKGHCEFVD